jgi:hypothetical protein
MADASTQQKTLEEAYVAIAARDTALAASQTELEETKATLARYQAQAQEDEMIRLAVLGVRLPHAVPSRPLWG